MKPYEIALNKSFSMQMFHGVFEAVSPGCLNLDRHAFGGNARGGSSRPAQVQVTYTEKFFPTHWWLFENVPGLFYAGTNKVDQLLNEEQVSLTLHFFGFMTSCHSERNAFH